MPKPSVLARHSLCVSPDVRTDGDGRRVNHVVADEVVCQVVDDDGVGIAGTGWNADVSM